jgi:CheY-like chemotaxis protein
MKHSVVVVDDENDILRILSEVLLTSGYKPVTFWDAASAYAYVLRHKPALVVTDLRMPGMSGQELIARLREQCGNDLPIVVMSASVSSAAITGLPIQEFLSKPFDLDDFLGSVEKLLEWPQQYKASSRR